MSIPRKLRYSFSYPALTATHPSRSVSNSTLVDSWPLSLAFTPLSPAPAINETGTQDEETEASQESRASSPSGNVEVSHRGPYQVSDAYRNRVAGAMRKLKDAFDTDWAEQIAKAVAKANATKDEEWAERLQKAVAQAETVKDEEWAECLKKAVAQAETAKDEELDIFDRFKESSHENNIKDLEDDHENQIKELEERYAETLQELTKKHDEEILALTKKHAAEARKLGLGRAQGAKEVIRLKQELSDMEAEKIATEKDLIHMTGQRDAMHKAFAAMTGQSPPQLTAPSEPSQTDQDQIHRPGEVEETDGTANKDSPPTTLAEADMSMQTVIPATLYKPPQPHPPPQPNHPSIVPQTFYPRIQLLESENALLRTDLEQRHQDVTYATHKSDNLRALLEADPEKSDMYADVLIHKEMIQHLQTRLQESWEAFEREKVESQRLRESIDVVVEERKKEEVGRALALHDKEAAWAQNENLVRELKRVFGKNEYDTAFWTHYELLVKEKEGLEGDIAGYKLERRELMEEAIDSKAKIAQLELDLALAASTAADKDDEGGIQDLKNQLLILQVENDALRAEVEFQIAELENQKVGLQMPRMLQEVQEKVLEEKNREIEDLKGRIGGGEVQGEGGGELEGILGIRAPRELEVVRTRRSLIPAFSKDGLIGVRDVVMIFCFGAPADNVIGYDIEHVVWFYF